MEIAGIDADSIISQLMMIEQRPLVALQQRKDDAKLAADAIGRIRTKVDAFRLAAERLSTLSNFSRYSTTVSNTNAVSASISGTASVSSLSFTVDQLAQSHGLRSIGTVASDAVTITSDSLIAVAAGTSTIGIGTVRAGAGLTAGELTVSVTQASAAARVSGGTPLAASTVIDGTNNTLDVTVNGTAHSLTIASGTYDEAGLAAAVQSALDTAGVAATATLDNSGALELATTREGSAASIQVTGGTSLAGLGLTIDASAHTGTDGIIDVGGTTTTVTSIDAGDAVAVSTGTGTLDVTLSGGLRAGSSDVNVVSTGDGSLADVASAITNANQGVSAAAVQVATGQWRLQLTATATGEDGAISIDTSTLTGLGGMIESSAAQNAQITIGSGAGAYQVEASGNTFRNVVPGVTLTAKAVTTEQVNVSVAKDHEAVATDVANLVSKLNELIGDLKVQTRADPTAGTSGPLAGNATIRSLGDRLRNALANEVSGLALALPSSVGITRDRSGDFSFDKSKFIDAIENDPDAVARLFARGGTDTGDVTFTSATGETVTGSYDVNVTTAATRATSAVLFDGGAVADTRIGIRIGDTTVNYDVTAGQTAAQIIDGLNDALAASGLDVVAEANGTGLQLRAEDWGAGGDFELNTDVLGVGTWDAQTGTDVVGTINGIAATGIGRQLSLASTADDQAAGLSVTVAGGVTGAIGTVEYLPGIAARVVEITTAMTDRDTGSLTTAEEFAENRIEAFGDQITRLEDRLFIRETNLRRQWSSFQTLLSGLQSQGDWLAGQLGSLNTNWSG